MNLQILADLWSWIKIIQITSEIPNFQQIEQKNWKAIKNLQILTDLWSWIKIIQITSEIPNLQQIEKKWKSNQKITNSDRFVKLDQNYPDYLRNSEKFWHCDAFFNFVQFVHWCNLKNKNLG